MGNNQGVDDEELEYYTEIEDPQLGHCKVYSSNKFSNCFLIRVVKQFNQAGQLKLFSRVENQQNIYLLSLFGYRLGKNCNCNYNQPFQETVVSFWEYLSITLRQIITQRLNLGVRFQESEIWHILKASICGYEALLRNSVAFDFKPSKMMVNRDGRIRLNWMHSEQKNIHTTYYKKVLEGAIELGPEEYLSPEQLEAVKLKQFTAKINPEKSNVFSLGMTLLECLTLQNPITHFYSGLDILYDRINQVMGSSHCSIYSQNLLLLVGGMLCPEWHHRPTFSQIHFQHQHLMKRDYGIRTTRMASTLQGRKMSIKDKLLSVSTHEQH